MARLGDFIEQIRGVSYKPDDVCPELRENCIALLRANNIREGQLNVNQITKNRMKHLLKMLSRYFRFCMRFKIRLVN